MTESTHASERCSAPESGAPVVRLPLTAQQAEQITPMVLQASGRRENVIFFAVTVPFWSSEDESVVWELQATIIPARIGHKIKKLTMGAKV